jgi:hypothetical protein
MSDARFDPRFDPAFQPGYTGPIAEVRPPARPASVASDPVAIERSVTALVETAADDDPELRRLNPFLLALGAVAIVLVGGGLYLVSRLRDLFADVQASSNVDYVTLQVLISAAPLLVALGVATGIGVLFVLATRWDRR